MRDWLAGSFRRTAAAGIMLLLAAGCQGQNPDNEEAASMVSVLASETHCGEEKPGLELVDTDSGLPSVGGGERIERAAGKGAALLLVNLGERPTPGYSAELSETLRDGDTLVLNMNATAPAPDAMVAQVITTPCVVLEVPSSGWSRLEVRMDAEGFPLTLEHPNPG